MQGTSWSTQFLMRCSALRELALTFYDTRAIVVELVARLVGMGTRLGTPLYARQLAALEALQIYAPLGHGLGLRALCAQLEDRCFQVWHMPCLCTAPASWHQNCCLRPSLSSHTFTTQVRLCMKLLASQSTAAEFISIR